MRILIYGAGAVGGYFASKLIKSGHDVTIVIRPVMEAAIQNDGLGLIENGRLSRTKPKMLTNIAPAFKEDEAPFDLIILTMKGYDLEGALNPLVAFCPEPNMVMTVQAGIDPEAPVIDAYGADHVLVGAFTTPVSRETINRVKIEKAGGGLGLSSPNPKAKIKDWVTLFKGAGINTKAFKDYRSMKWSDALFNMTGNASSAIVNRPPNLLYKSDTMYDLELRMLQEAVAVMRHYKIKVTDVAGRSVGQLSNGAKRSPGFLFKRFLTGEVANSRGEMQPSFASDLSAKRGKNEVVFHNGAIADAGEAVGIYAPVNRAFSNILLKMSLEQLDWQEFDGRPKRLLAEIKKTAQQMKTKRDTGRLGE